MEYLILWLGIAVALLIFFVKGFWDNKQQKKQYASALKKNYGKEPIRKYSEKEYEGIQKYFLKHQSDFVIDDITWNDLGMDAIFAQMNYTHSSAGEEYLYYLLRTPRLVNEGLDDMEQKITFFQKEEEERVRLQLLFTEMGRTGKYSIYDYLDHLLELGKRSNFWNVFFDLLFIPAFLLFFIHSGYAITVILALLVYNVITYFREKGKIDPYIISFAYLFRVLRGVEQLNAKKIDVYQEEQLELERRRKKFKKFSRNSSILMSASRMSGNPLEIIVDYLRICFHLDIIKFNSMLHEFMQHTEDVDVILTTIGKMESYLAIGEYRTFLGSYCVPVFGQKLQVENCFHPMISEPVKNSISVNQGVLLTGSNASGKSTFLKTMAINALLAQTIHTCPADSYSGEMYRIYTSMALRDDLSAGESYYVVEIKSLKRILDAKQNTDSPVLCFVDEVLRGTNTVERIAASTQILKSLCGYPVCCFAATHDIELTALLEQEYDNYHFEEKVEEDTIHFPYLLLDGKATTRNAIKLLSIMGYEEDIIKNANDLAETFLETGKWETCIDKA